MKLIFLSAVALILGSQGVRADTLQKPILPLPDARRCLELLRQGSVYPRLTRATQSEIVAQLRRPLAAGKQGVRMVTDVPFEAPDPERPAPIHFRDGRQKYLIGLSGQHFILVDQLTDYVRGGVQPLYKVYLKNENGHTYGGEINPATGLPIGYAGDSSVWDIAAHQLFDDGGKPVFDSEGNPRLKVFAGAMGNDQFGRPLLIAHNNTRQRRFFDGVLKTRVVDGKETYEIIAGQPKAPLNRLEPTGGDWFIAGRFNHGYGGGPVTLLNGELYRDELGRVPFIYEAVVEQSIVDGRKNPQRTAILVAYMDPTLSVVLEGPKIILDVYKQNGEVFKAAQRQGYGPLVEGGHLIVKVGGRPLGSMAEVREMRARDQLFEFSLDFSAGEYYGQYGSFEAVASGNLENLQPVLDEDGELYDLTAPLKGIFGWMGRPARFYVGDQEYVQAHGMDFSELPQGLVLGERPEDDRWQHFKRGVFVFPVDVENGPRGQRRRVIRDDTGLLQRLQILGTRRRS